MTNTSWFLKAMTDDEIWKQLQALLQKYSPDTLEREKEYLKALEQISASSEEAHTINRAYRSAIISDALFAFQKGMEANMFHFRNPHVPSIINVDFNDLYQEHVMGSMPKRVAAEKIISIAEVACLQANESAHDTIREYIVDLEVTVPKIMHLEGYLAGNTWFALTIPGYQEDQALTSIYSLQIHQYFGRSLA